MKSTSVALALVATTAASVTAIATHHHRRPASASELALVLPLSATYHGGEPGDATVVLDKRHVTEVRDTLTAWLERDGDAL